MHRRELRRSGTAPPASVVVLHDVRVDAPVVLSQASDSFWHSPGFGGLGAVVAAVIIGLSALYATRQRNAANESQLVEERGKREDAERAGEVQRCWDRFVWVVAFAEVHAADDPVLVTDLCERVYASAVGLNDLGLRRMVKVYLDAALYQLAPSPDS